MITLNLKKYILPIFATLLLFMALMPMDVHAQVLDVTFEQTPLFNEMNVAPGMEVMRVVTVKNNGTEVESVYTSATNASSTGLADYIYLSIAKDSSIYLATSTFSSFFVGNPVALGTVNPGATVTYKYAASMPDTSNIAQGLRMQFDLVVGFEGGESVTDDDEGGGRIIPRDPVLPDGVVAGVSTTAPTFVQSFVNETLPSWLDSAGGVPGEVAGASTTATSTVSSDSGESDENKLGQTIKEALAVVQDNCTFWWLLLLALISFSWSLIDDKFGATNVVQDKMFKRALIFSSLYLGGLLLGLYFNFIDGFWWMFAIVWSSFVIYDYVIHKTTTPNWTTTNRNYFYATLSAVAIITSMVWGIPCVAWPFMVIAIVSIIAAVLD